MTAAMDQSVSRLLLVVGLVLTTFCESVLAKTDSQSSWTIDGLVAQALAHNAELRAYEAQVIAARANRKQAALWKNPEFSGDYGQKRIRDNEGQIDQGEIRSFSISQPFEFPGKGSLRKAIANKEIELAELGLEQFKLSLIGKVRTLSYRYLASIANAQVAEQISERSSALIQLLQERAIAGAQPLLELRAIEGSLIELQKSTHEFLAAGEEARIELTGLLGWPSSTMPRLSDTLAEPNRQIDLQKAIFAGLKQNFQLRIRTAEVEKAVKEISAARLEALPDFAVGPFFSQETGGETEESLGASISFTLPLWNWNQGGVATAKARQLQADALLLDARQKLESEIARKIRAYELSLRLSKQITSNQIQKLRDAADLADRQYRTGNIPIQLYLELQREFLNAQVTRNQVLLEAWNHLLDLKLLTGEAEGKTR